MAKPHRRALAAMRSGRLRSQPRAQAKRTWPPHPSSTSAVSITIGQGVASGAVETALIGPIAMAANSSLQFYFPQRLSFLREPVADFPRLGCSCGRTEAAGAGS
jgi:hypothetical protein